MQTAEFDENGNTITEGMEPNTEVETEVEETETETEGEGKYQIGDKYFNTLEEAHAFATSQLSTLEAEQQISNAYRQGIQDASISGQPGQNVTQEQNQPTEDDFDEEEYFANPKEFLKKFESKITQKVVSTYDQKLTLKEQSNRIWNEFTERHPNLADYREDAEGFVSQNGEAVRAIIATKGQAAAYDYIALKLKEKFNRYAKAVLPQKKLSNAGAGASPTGARTNVTPKKGGEKPLSFSEQIRKIKKQR